MSKERERERENLKSAALKREQKILSQLNFISKKAEQQNFVPPICSHL